MSVVFIFLNFIQNNRISGIHGFKYIDNDIGTVQSSIVVCAYLIVRIH